MRRAPSPALHVVIIDHPTPRWQASPHITLAHVAGIEFGSCTAISKTLHFGALPSPTTVSGSNPVRRTRGNDLYQPNYAKERGHPQPLHRDPADVHHRLPLGTFQPPISLWDVQLLNKVIQDHVGPSHQEEGPGRALRLRDRFDPNNYWVHCLLSSFAVWPCVQTFPGSV